MTSIAAHPTCWGLLKHLSSTSAGRIDNGVAPLLYTGAEPPDPWWLASALQESHEADTGDASWPSLQRLCRTGPHEDTNQGPSIELFLGGPDKQNRVLASDL